jgi:hypothetical protein
MSDHTRDSQNPPKAVPSGFVVRKVGADRKLTSVPLEVRDAKLPK